MSLPSSINLHKTRLRSQGPRSTSTIKRHNRVPAASNHRQSPLMRPRRPQVVLKYRIFSRSNRVIRINNRVDKSRISNHDRRLLRPLQTSISRRPVVPPVLEYHHALSTQQPTAAPLQEITDNIPPVPPNSHQPKSLQHPTTRQLHPKPIRPKFPPPTPPTAATPNRHSQAKPKPHSRSHARAQPTVQSQPRPHG